MNIRAYQGIAAGAWVPPAPQLLKDVLMLVIGYRADPTVLREVLPPGLEPHESGLVQMNMYECPDPARTSGFGAFSLTYLTVEVAGHDSQAAEGTLCVPGRYWVGYWNSSARVRTFAREQAGIPALPGECTWTVEGDRLVSRLSVDGATVIEATARVGTDPSPRRRHERHQRVAGDPDPVHRTPACGAGREHLVRVPARIPVRPVRPAEPAGNRGRPARQRHVHLFHGPADPRLPG
jgi:acetoacetate decarboxylase